MGKKKDFEEMKEHGCDTVILAITEFDVDFWLPNLRHIVEPTSCYSLELFRTSRDGQGESRSRFILAPNEALGVSLAIEKSFGVICFGIPMLVPHDTSKYRRETREARNAQAAA